MNPTGSVTDWLDRLRRGDELAAQRLWERYYERLVSLAAKKLGSLPRRAADEEDVASLAFAQFFQGLSEGRFPELHDRHDLWQVLLMLVDRRSVDQMRKDGRRREMEVGESGISDIDAKELATAALDRFAHQDPSPDFLAQMFERIRQLLAALDDELLRQLALWKLAGHTNDEIAALLGKVPRTVERKLQLIRARWLQLLEEPTA